MMLTLAYRHILKTNFYQPTKVALSFRLDPKFLPPVEYPKTPFGMFFIIGNEFRGFHLRFSASKRRFLSLVAKSTHRGRCPWWHSHYSSQYGSGLFGPIVIYGPKDDEVRYPFKKS